MIELNKDDFLSNLGDLKQKKVGYVAIIGRPNAGKSTFINALIGEKVSIVSNVPQTTRKRVLAIYNDEESQIVFFDTPGIHKDDKTFNEAINKQATSSLNDAEVVLYFIDSTREGGEEEKYIKSLVGGLKVPVVKVYTKTDMFPVINIPQKAFSISSMTKDGFGPVMNQVKAYLKPGQILFPEEYYTASDVLFRISEIIREKVFTNTKEEIPHSSFVEVEDIDEKDDLVKVSAYIYTETDSQRYIIIGKAGKVVARIGKEARIELEKIYGKKVFLSLRVKTMEKWRKNSNVVKRIFK